MSTEVISEHAQIVEAIKRFQAGTRRVWLACVEESLPAFSVGEVKQGYLAAKARGVEIRYITEVTDSNLRFCREITEYAELRHMDGVQGNFALSESEYIAGFMSEGIMTRLVRTDVPELVRQQHLVFETLWHTAQPAADVISGL